MNQESETADLLELVRETKRGQLLLLHSLFRPCFIHRLIRLANSITSQEEVEEVEEEEEEC